MNKEARVLFKTKIKAKILAIEQNIEELTEQVKPISPDDAYGRVSRIDAINNKAVIENSLRMAKSKRSKLFAALEQVNHPNFGKCIRCNRLIALERLIFMPEANKCIQCAH